MISNGQVKALIILVFIAVLANAVDLRCLSFYRMSNTETHPSLSQPDAVVYDIHAIGNSWENPFTKADPKTFWSIPLSTFTVTRLRENPANGKLPDNIENENYLYQTSLQSSLGLLFLSKENRQSLNQIYANYAKQGPERSENVKTYQQEDMDYRDRTTHFLLQRELKTVGRIQLQHSLNPSQPLNVEVHFPEGAPAAIRRGPEKIYFELGRLHIPHPKKDGLGLRDDYDRQLAFLELFLRPFLYVSKQTPNAGIVFQTNEFVLETIKQRIFPYQLREVTLISKPGEPKEFLTVIRSDEVKKLTQIFFLKRFQLVLDQFANSHLGEFRFTIHPDEKPYYEALDVHNLTIDWTRRNFEPVWKNHFKEALGPLRNASTKMDVSFSFDTSIFINPHFVSLGQKEVRILFQRIQSKLSKLSQ